MASRKVVWIRELTAANLTPDVVVLDVVDCDKLSGVEQAWILKLWDQPGHLVNIAGAPDHKEYLRAFYAAREEAWAQRRIRHGDPTEAEPPLDASPAKPMGS